MRIAPPAVNHRSVAASYVSSEVNREKGEVMIRTHLKSADGRSSHTLNDRQIGGEQSDESFVHVERESWIGLTETVQQSTGRLARLLRDGLHHTLRHRTDT